MISSCLDARNECTDPNRENLKGISEDPTGIRRQMPKTRKHQPRQPTRLEAQARLAEVESRSRFLDEIHDGVPGIAKTGLD